MKEQMMAQFDPSNEGLDKTLDFLAKADKSERERVLAAEVSGKRRKTILEKYGIDPDARYDATGRLLYPWEVTGDDMADAKLVVEESDEAREAREAQAEADAKVAAATEQGGTTDGVGATTSAGATGTSGPADAAAGTATA